MYFIGVNLPLLFLSVVSKFSTYESDQIQNAIHSRGQETASTKASTAHFYSWQYSNCSYTTNIAIPLVSSGDACSLWSYTCSTVPNLHATSSPSS
jgi:hypothetical protein